MGAASEKLQQGAARLVTAKASYDSKVAGIASSNTTRSFVSALKLDGPPSRPSKRKSGMVELSDSEDEPVMKRRQVNTSPIPSVPATATSTSTSTSRASVKPWDQVHAGKKLPTSTKPDITTAKPKTKAPALEIVELSTQQKAILEEVLEGKSVFFTGSAGQLHYLYVTFIISHDTGTGKSVLLRSIIKDLRRKHNRSTDAVAVTASTGIAACNIGGVTLHSFSGVGLGSEPAPQLVAKVKRNPKATSRWQRTKVLIIDESANFHSEQYKS